jgi:hypothetical protein
LTEAGAGFGGTGGASGIGDGVGRGATATLGDWDGLGVGTDALVAALHDAAVPIGRRIAIKIVETIFRFFECFMFIPFPSKLCSYGEITK